MEVTEDSRKRAGEGGLEGNAKRREAVAPNPVTAADGQRSGGQGGNQKGATQDLMQLVLKNGLHNSQELRLLKGLAVNTTVVPTEHAIVTAMRDRTRAWQARLLKAKENEEKVDLGPPFLQAWAALLDTLMAELPDGDTKQQVKVINDACNAIEDLEFLTMLVGTCRLEKMFNKTQTKIVWASHPTKIEWTSSIRKALNELGGTHKLGAAPPSGLEKAMSATLSARTAPKV